jgi:hypothetical protein
MPEWQDATAMLGQAMRYGQPVLYVDELAFTHMKESGRFLLHGGGTEDAKLEYQHPFGTLWICIDPQTRTHPQPAADWTNEPEAEPAPRIVLQGGANAFLTNVRYDANRTYTWHTDEIVPFEQPEQG